MFPGEIHLQLHAYVKYMYIKIFTTYYRHGRSLINMNESRKGWRFSDHERSLGLVARLSYLVWSATWII